MFTADNKHFNLKRNVYDFSTDCNAIDKSGLLNILKYVMVKKNL